MKTDSILSASGGDEIVSTASVSEQQTKCAPANASFGCLDNTTLKRPGRGRTFAGNDCHVLRPTITTFCFSMSKDHYKQYAEQYHTNVDLSYSYFWISKISCLF